MTDGTKRTVEWSSRGCKHPLGRRERKMNGNCVGARIPMWRWTVQASICSSYCALTTSTFNDFDKDKKQAEHT
ncbi:hypothetical protein KIN20_010432 [Parelaphostrongylus tenuis]|uniref:Uncharacterized protein n=1 Tax=Parelaphostrongylus tenuis TaxID=148309 RepID=A0AAD5MCJ7_PARTN|nr:hypothetical protein KIN20_010432 [Parelaphostrongylus tenuis]